MLYKRNAKVPYTITDVVEGLQTQRLPDEDELVGWLNGLQAAWDEASPVISVAPGGSSAIVALARFFEKPAKDAAG